MTVLIIDDDCIQAEKFIEYARTLPFARVEETKKMSFEEACSECNGITADAFFDELDFHIENWTK